MRFFVIVIQLTGFHLITCLAQQPSQAASISKTTPQENPASTTANSLGDVSNNCPKLPAGTLVRPEGGVQYEDLDKAWDDYMVAVEKTSQAIRVIITKQLDNATKRGNLEAVEKWQKISDRFTNGEGLPDKGEMEVVINNPVLEYVRAKDKLTSAYALAVKALTKKKNIADAQKFRDEIIEIKKVADKGCEKTDFVVSKEEQSIPKKDLFLSDLTEKDVVVGWGHFGKNGWLGYSERDGRVRVKNRLYGKALSMHGVSGGVAKVTYEVPAGYDHFDGVAAISDTVDGRQRTPLTLKLIGDDCLLWSSKPLFGGGTAQRCNVSLKGSKRITLVVECPGENGWAQAVWCDPHFVAD
jgi:hypothetical protein